MSALLREVLALKGMAPEQVDLNLPGLLEQETAARPGRLTKPGSERRASFSKETQPKSSEPQTGHGPTAQPQLLVLPEVYDVDEADKICPPCGDAMVDWHDHDDETEVVDVIKRPRW